MRKEVVMITGASGEIGQGLISHLSTKRDIRIVALDIQPLNQEFAQLCDRFILGDILDPLLLGRLISEYEIRTIYHLASILSTKAEYNPENAHKVNVEGTLNLLRLAVEQSHWQGRPVKFLYPSSIAVYGLPSLEKKYSSGKIREFEWLHPITMYGCNKLYCEQLGRYYATCYRQLAADRQQHTIDFRGLRFPGLISATTVPTGGTSDYAPEMLHYASQGLPYKCFVRPDTCLPFMAMPDAIKALLELESAPVDALSRLVYNVTSFSLQAKDINQIVLDAFPNADINFESHQARQIIVDSWPADIDDSAAQEDWGWKPEYGLQQAFHDYLIPGIKAFYKKP